MGRLTVCVAVGIGEKAMADGTTSGTFATLVGQNTSSGGDLMTNLTSRRTGGAARIYLALTPA